MDRRKRQILDILSDNEYYTAEDLAEQICIGTKTIRNLLKEMNQEIEPYGASILSKYGVGYYLNVSDKEKFGSFIQDTHHSDQYLPGKGDLTHAILAYDYPKYLKFDLGKMFDEVCEGKQFETFANSFLTIWSRHEEN